MPLVNNPSPENLASAGEDADRAQRRKETAEKHRAKLAAERQANHEFALKLRDHEKASGTFDKLSDDAKSWLLNLCVPPSERAHQGPSFLIKLFGPAPKVGQSITLDEVMTKTYKGLDTMSSSIKKWAKRGIDVSVKYPTEAEQKADPKHAMIKNTVFTITKLATASV